MSIPFLLCAWKRTRLNSSGFVRWCNGSTRPFGGLCPGSNPGRTANLPPPTVPNAFQFSNAGVRGEMKSGGLMAPSGERWWTTRADLAVAPLEPAALPKGLDQFPCDLLCHREGGSSTRTCSDHLTVNWSPAKSVRHSKCKWSGSLTPSLKTFDQKARPASERFSHEIHRPARGNRRTGRQPMLLAINDLRNAPLNRER
jgi:hypothetical protein